MAVSRRASFGTNVEVAVESITVATGTGVTVTVASPNTPSLVARTRAVPGETAETSPLVETLAMASAEELHATARPASALPCASRGVADNWVVVPASTLGPIGVTETEATATGGGGMETTEPLSQAAARRSESKGMELNGRDILASG
jgi:hypothetical protein